MIVSHDKVGKAFANGQEVDGGNLRTRVLPNGVTILYSYATPVAYRTDNRVRFDARSYSASTARQVAKARRACAGLPDVETIEHETIRADLLLFGASLSGAR